MNIPPPWKREMFCPNNRPSRIQLHPWPYILRGIGSTPRPRITKYGLRDNVQGRWVGPTIRGPDANTDFRFVFVVFGVFDEDVPVAVVVEAVGVEKFEFADVSVAIDGFLDETFIRVFALWVFVQVFHVGMGGSGILPHPY